MELVRYDAMVTAIAECERVDEVKDIRDKAVALEAYARQANNYEAERKCALVRVRAERKCGQMLAERNNAQGRRTDLQTNLVERDDQVKTLAEMGITKDQSSTWQKLAAVPEQEFEEALTLTGHKPSARHIIRTPEPEPKRMDKSALWFWGRLRDMREMNLFDTDINEMLSEWTDAMREDAEHIIPKLKKWVNQYD